MREFVKAPAGWPVFSFRLDEAGEPVLNEKVEKAFGVRTDRDRAELVAILKRVAAGEDWNA